jgi:starvation-inducible DNA-binding protein
VAKRTVMTQQEYHSLLKEAFATEYAFYLKAQNFHWNVTGYLFPQYHEFFGHIYEEVGSCLDAFAEHLRTKNIQAPASFEQLQSLSKIAGQDNLLTGLQMCEQLLADSDLAVEIFKTAYQVAEATADYGLANFLAERQSQHEKHSWQLMSTIS